MTRISSDEITGFVAGMFLVGASVGFNAIIVSAKTGSLAAYIVANVPAGAGLYLFGSTIADTTWPRLAASASWVRKNIAQRQARIAEQRNSGEGL